MPPAAAGGTFKRVGPLLPATHAAPLRGQLAGAAGMLLAVVPWHRRLKAHLAAVSKVDF
jgi:hypothetical protein